MVLSRESKNGDELVFLKDGEVEEEALNDVMVVFLEGDIAFRVVRVVMVFRSPATVLFLVMVSSASSSFAHLDRMSAKTR